MNAVILAIGDELITGQTVDTNSAYLACELGQRGIAVLAHQTVGDDVEAIAHAIKNAAERADVIIATGGLGPTEDDLTRQAIARVLNVPLELDEASLEEIKARFAKHSWPMAECNRVQAMFPAGTEPLANSCGTAPGIHATIGRAEFFVLPGVPREMRAMFAERVAGRLPDGDGVILHRVLHTFGLGESTLSERICDLMDRQANPTVGTTAAGGMVSIRITSRAQTIEAASSLTDRLADELHSRLGPVIVGEGGRGLPKVVGELLGQRGETVSTAESCTGGLVGEMITRTPGSSGYYRGGVIAYSNEIKQRLLSVPAELLDSHGAVSEQVAAAMADGCRKRCGSDHAISITGIAGPEGGTDNKPVGLVFIGLVGPASVETHRHVFSGDRQTVRTRAALTALNYLRLTLLGIEDGQMDR